MNRPALTAMIRLAAFATACIITLTTIFLLVRPTIAQQQQKALLAQFQELLPNHPISGELLDSATETTIDGIQATLFTAKTTDGKHLATFIRTATNQGYNGHIGVLIAIAADNRTLIGIRALEHTETPGLGDKIDTNKSAWVHEFDNQTLQSKKFAVRKDGGDIDAFTGATITPRAITNLVGRILTAWQKEHTT